MRLDQLLVHNGLCESREEAKESIKEGYVLVDGVVVTKATRSIPETASLSVSRTRKYVSRGGEKLEGALYHMYNNKDTLQSSLSGLTALDVGSSTGGFTECLLSYGINHVVAVDVGTLQLHPKLRNDLRITVYENTDIRNFTSSVSFDFIVADLSFIPLEKVLPAIFSLGNDSTTYFLLIKPQFEVGKGNTKKGIVRDTEKVDLVLEKYMTLVKSMGHSTVQIFPSSITGGEGNQEYFLYSKK